MKHLITFVFLVISVGLIAQTEKPIEKGQLILGGGGSVSYGTELTDTESTTGYISLSLYPSVGVFLAHGFALGASPSFGFSSDFGDYTNRSTSIGLGLFLVKYFEIGLFIRGTIDYDIYFYNYESYYSSNDSHLQSISFIPEVGYAFFLGPNVALELSLRDHIIWRLIPDSSNTLISRTYISVGFQIFL